MRDRLSVRFRPLTHPDDISNYGSSRVTGWSAPMQLARDPRRSGCTISLNSGSRQRKGLVTSPGSQRAVTGSYTRTNVSYTLGQQVSIFFLRSCGCWRDSLTRPRYLLLNHARELAAEVHGDPSQPERDRGLVVRSLDYFTAYLDATVSREARLDRNPKPRPLAFPRSFRSLSLVDLFIVDSANRPRLDRPRRVRDIARVLLHGRERGRGIRSRA